MRHGDPSILVCLMRVAWWLASLCCKSELCNAVSEHLLRVRSVIAVLEISQLRLCRWVLKWSRSPLFFYFDDRLAWVVTRVLLSVIWFKQATITVWPVVVLIQNVRQLILKLGLGALKVRFRSPWSTCLPLGILNLALAAFVHVCEKLGVT